VAKIKVAIAGTVGKSVSFDPNAGARAEAAVAALAAQISAGIGGNIRHSVLQGLQVGDDHPQYTGWQFPETIVGQWNFQTIPQIQGETLAEYIQDVVGADFFDFLQDTSSVVWTYLETANELEANVPPEFVQDTVGAMLTTTSSIALAYDDGAGTFSATIVDEYIQDLVDALMIDSTSVAWTYSDVGGTLSAATVNANPSGLIGMSAVNGTAATPLRSDGRHAIDPAIAPEWTANHGWADNAEIQLGAGNDLRLYHDGTNSIIRNDTGDLNFFIGATNIATLTSSQWLVGAAAGNKSRMFAQVWSVSAPTSNVADFRYQTADVDRWYIRKDADAESGSNAGSSLAIIARSDAGGSLGSALTFTRSNLQATFGGRIVGSASTTTRATLNVPHGTAPSSPANGDIWTTTAGLFVRINGATVGPLA
jgi:hypothetical protein